MTTETRSRLWHYFLEEHEVALKERHLDEISAIIDAEQSISPFGPEADKQIREDLDNLTIRKT